MKILIFLYFTPLIISLFGSGAAHASNKCTDILKWKEELIIYESYKKGNHDKLKPRKFLKVANKVVPLGSFLELSLFNGEKISGQVFHFYDGEWFTLPGKGNDYIGLFNTSKGRIPEVDLIPVEQVSNVKISEKNLNWRSDLHSNGIFFQRVPLEHKTWVITANEGHHLLENLYGDKAYDFVYETASGKHFVNEGRVLEDYGIYGKSVLSPVNGVVTHVQKNVIDNLPIPYPTEKDTKKLGNREPNFLVIHIAGQFSANLVHFSYGSIEVNVGDYINVGQYLGKVGNSGVSLVPHLHMTMYAWIPRLSRFVSVPGDFFQYALYNPQSESKSYRLKSPSTDDRISHSNSGFYVR